MFVEGVLPDARTLTVIVVSVALLTVRGTSYALSFFQVMLEAVED